jgi:hypothetical protein
MPETFKGDIRGLSKGHEMRRLAFGSIAMAQKPEAGIQFMSPMGLMGPIKSA